jgi:hypothetical protein
MRSPELRLALPQLQMNRRKPFLLFAKAVHFAVTILAQRPFSCFWCAESIFGSRRKHTFKTNTALDSDWLHVYPASCVANSTAAGCIRPDSTGCVCQFADGARRQRISIGHSSPSRICSGLISPRTAGPQETEASIRSLQAEDGENPYWANQGCRLRSFRHSDGSHRRNSLCLLC